ncbi:MAG: septum formation protein Maf [Pseudomonadota bacterium]|jgi:septum formation protein
MPDFSSPHPKGLVLASGSRFRRDMLQRAGLSFTVDPADIDERGLSAALERETPEIRAETVARALAVAKARSVAPRHPGKRIIGSDQILALPAQNPGAKDKIFAKPKDLSEARAHIAQLQGRTHYLHTAAAVVENESILWQTVKTAALTMRPLSDAEIDAYIARAGSGVCDTVGAYMLEGLGVQLFERIEGDNFTIIGLPLLELLAALRDLGEVSL